MMAARIRIRDAGGTLRTVAQLRMRDAAGTLRTITRVRVRDQNNVLRIVYDPAGASSLSASASPSIVHGTSMGSGTVSTNNTTVTPTGGTAPYTYAWTVIEYDNGVSPTIAGPTSATTGFTQTSVGPGEFYSATFRCTVTDAATNTATADVQAGFVDIS